MEDCWVNTHFLFSCGLWWLYHSWNLVRKETQFGPSSVWKHSAIWRSVSSMEVLHNDPSTTILENNCFFFFFKFPWFIVYTRCMYICFVQQIIRFNWVLCSIPRCLLLETCQLPRLKFRGIWWLNCENEHCSLLPY